RIVERQQARALHFACNRWLSCLGFSNRLARGFEMGRLNRVHSILLMVACGGLTAAGSALAGTIDTYTWIGNNGFTGYFSLDSSAFSSTSIFYPIFNNSSKLYQAIPESYLTSFAFAGAKISFPYSSLNQSVIWFDSAVNPPAYADGGGY